jgi:hypothetical protein
MPLLIHETGLGTITAVAMLFVHNKKAKGLCTELASMKWACMMWACVVWLVQHGSVLRDRERHGLDCMGHNT